MNHKLCTLLHITCCALLLFVISAKLHPAKAEAADLNLQLNDFVLDSTDGLLTLRYGIAVSDLEQFRIALQKGAKLALICTATITLNDSIWLDSELRNNELRSEIFLDKLTREFMLTLSNNNAPFRQRALKPLLEETWGTLSQPLIPIAQLEQGQTYTVTLNVRMENLNDDSWIPDMLFFWNGDGLPEVQYTMDFDF